MKGGHVNPVEFVIIEECMNVSVFLQFVLCLLERKVLSRGDMSIVDSTNAEHFIDNTDIEMSNFNLSDTISFYRHCGHVQ